MIKSPGIYIILIFFTILFGYSADAQNLNKTDSLVIELNKTHNDSTRVEILSKLFWEHRRSAPDIALAYSEKALQISRSTNYPQGIANSLHNIGIIMRLQGDYDSSLIFFEEAKALYLEINDTIKLASCYTDIGDIFYKLNNYTRAFEYFDKARNLIILTGNKEKLSRIYSLLGGIYCNQKQYEKALLYHQKSLDINRELNFKRGMSVNYNNIGIVNYEQKQYADATENYKKSLEIKKELNDISGVASTLNNLGLIFSNKKEYHKALDYHNRALNKYQELGDKSGVAMCLINVSNDYLESGEVLLAIEFAEKGLKNSGELNLKKVESEGYRILSEANASLRQYKKAWQYQKLHKIYNDSTVSIKIIRQIGEMESKFEMEKKEKEIALLNSEKEKQELKMQKQRLQQNLLIGLTILVLVVLFFVYWGYRNKRKLNKKLEDLNLTKSRFFANISHEFRTPLTLLLGPLEKLLKSPNQDDKELIGMMHRNASRLLFLDNQLLDLAKLESGKLKLEVSHSEIIQVLKGMVMSFQSMAENKKISFQCIFPNQEIMAYFDQEKLEKIVYNLLSNALKFTPENGKVIFELILLPNKNKKDIPSGFRKVKGKIICLRICDTGPGIAEEHLVHIFERFYRADYKHKSGFEGTGIGLSISKELIELHHGKIYVDSKSGNGSVFKVFLPIDKSAFRASEIIDAINKSSNTSIFAASLQDENISENNEIIEDQNTRHQKEDLLQLLIVEDNKDMSSYISDCFDGQYNIIKAANGLSGYETAISKTPDIIITDLMMPKMDGIELCNKLKTDERTSHIPVILLTALSSVEDRIKGLETGADDYMAKPFNRKELLIRVQNLIDQRKLLQARFGKEIKIQAKDITVTSADEKFLNKLILFIEKNISNPDLNVDSLTNEINLSRSQLHRKLKSMTALSSTEFIRIIRLKRAAQLMEQHSGTIAETIYAVGFNSLSYFSKCFQKQFGMSPKEYIETLKKQKDE